MYPLHPAFYPYLRYKCPTREYVYNVELHNMEYRCGMHKIPRTVQYGNHLEQRSLPYRVLYGLNKIVT